MKPEDNAPRPDPLPAGEELGELASGLASMVKGEGK